MGEKLNSASILQRIPERWRITCAAILTIFASIHLIYAFYLVTFGFDVIKLADTRFYFGFLAELSVVAASSTVVAALAYAVLMAVSSAVPLRAYRYSLIRRAIRLLKKSIVIRACLFAIIFCFLYLGFGVIRSLVIGLAAGPLLAQTINFLRPHEKIDLTGVQKLTSQLWDLVSEIRSAQKDGDEGRLARLEMEANSVIDKALRSRHHLKAEFKKRGRSSRRSGRLYELYMKGTLATSVCLVALIGAFRALEVLDRDAVQVETSTISKVVLIGQTNHFLLVRADRSDSAGGDTTIAIPLADATIYISGSEKAPL